MKRRRFTTIFGTLAIGAGTALGTGAFSTVSAERSFTVSTADDQDGLLELKQGSGAAADRIVNNTSTDNGRELEFNFGTNVNDNALTAFDGILEIANNADNNLSVTKLIFQAEDGSGDAVTASSTDSGNNPIGVYKITNIDSSSEADPLDSAYDRKNDVTNEVTKFPNDSNSGLSPGESVEVGFLIDTTGSTDLSTIENINIVAETAESGASE